MVNIIRAAFIDQESLMDGSFDAMFVATVNLDGFEKVGDFFTLFGGFTYLYVLTLLSQQR
jgi:hypothetical protein